MPLSGDSSFLRQRSRRNSNGVTPTEPSNAGGVGYKCSAVTEMGDRLATPDMGRKQGGYCALFGEACPHLTQYGMGRGLPPCQLASSSIQPFGHNRRGPKTGGCDPFRESWVPISHNVAWAEAYLHTNHHHHTTSVLRPFFQDHTGEPVPEENFWTL